MNDKCIFLYRHALFHAFNFDSMNDFTPVLTITGSDSTGGAGVQADIRTISALGGYALSVVTAVTVQNTQGIHAMHELPAGIVVGQLKAIMDDMFPRAIKVGMVRGVDSIRALADEIVACSRVVFDLVMVSSRGERLVTDDEVNVIKNRMLPHVKVLTLKSADAEAMLGCEVDGVDDMISTARSLLGMGPEAVLMKGGRGRGRMLTDVLVMEGTEDPVFFSSPDVDGWLLHGVGGTLSSAIATFMAKGDGVEKAVRQAHDYMRNLVVYSLASSRHRADVLDKVPASSVSVRHVELYNRFLALVARYYKESRDVAFYASEMGIGTKYLNTITNGITDKSPKQVIVDYLMREIERSLMSTSMTVQELAYMYGFRSQSLFSKFFCQHKGCSPSDFRKSHVV